MHCGVATPPDPGVPPRTMPTGEIEVARVRQVLGERYRIERVIGEGGMATVMLAEDVKHRRKVAVKVMRPELAATLGADRFLREVEIAARLSHPHILPLHDSGEAGGLLYYVMPYVEGESLSARIKREGELPVPEALRLAREVAEALAYAHKRGIIHRDIKPANILIGEGHALVADFGIARAVGAGGDAITKTGLAVGTPQYMSPEQATGAREVDGRTDVYALGAVLYEMLAGEPPFTGPTAQSVIARSLTESPRPLASTRAGVSGELAALVTRMLSKSPADRPDVAQLASALAEAEYGARGPTVGAPGPVSGSHPPVAAASAGIKRWLNWKGAAVVGVIALTAWGIGSRVLDADRAGASVDSARGTRVAVLPFESQGAAEDAYVAEGIVDELRARLAQVNGLTVLASTSTNQYRGSTKGPQEIARELDADYLLVGRVRWIGSDDARRAQVVPEVIDGQTGATTWQQTFATDLSRVLEVQAAIASAVAGKLGAKVGTREAQALTRRPTTNPAAWDLFLKARAIPDQGPPSRRQTAAYLEQAVALDSTFAEGWSALSVALSRVYFTGNRDPAARERSGVALRHALALDPAGAATASAEARYYTLVLPDPERAAAAADRAVLAAPKDAEILAEAADVDLRRGDTEDALALLLRAREIDPRSVQTLTALQRALIYSRRHTEALEVSEAVLALSPDNLQAIEWQAIAHLGRGDLSGARAAVRAAIDRGVSAPALVAYFAGYQEVSWMLADAEQRVLDRLTPAAFDGDVAWWGQALATAHWDRGRRTAGRAYADSSLAMSLAQSQAAPDDSQLRSLYALMLAYLGRKDEAIAGGERGLELTPVPTGSEGSYERVILVRILLAVGERERALEHIELLLRSPSPLSPAWLRIDPLFAPLKGNPRFERLVAGG